MSKLLKSKFLLGVAVFALAFVVAYSASAADGAITMTLKKGMKNVQVKYLQQTLNEKSYTVATTGAGSVGKETTTFGPATVSAVKAFQKAMGLVADGIFGAKSRAALGGSAPVTSSNCPAGALFNPTTGAPCTGTVVNNNPTGPVSVALATDNPAAGVLVSGQATADLMHVTFTGAGTVNSITLQRTGISSNTALSSVYLYNGSTRITDSASVNTNGLITFNGVNLAVNGSVTVSVKADIATGLTGGTVGVGLTSYTAAGASASAVSISGNVMSITAGGSGILGAVNFSTVSATTPSVNAGTTQYVLWTDSVQVSTHTMALKSAAFHFVGSAPIDSLANIGLFIDGTKVATGTGVNSLGYLVFDFGSAPYTLTTGSHSVDVRGDIIKGSYRSIQLTLQNAGDFMTMDSQLGVNVASTYNSGTFSPIGGPAISVNQGSLSIQIDPTFTSMTNVTGGATNALIGKYTITAYGEDEKIQTIVLTPTLTGTDNTSSRSLNNVQLYYNGSQVGSAQSYVATALTFNLGSSFIVPAGTTGTFEVHADMQNKDNANYTTDVITVASASIPVGGVQGMSSLQTNTSAVTIPATNGLTCTTGALSVAANPAYTAQTVNPNTPNVKIASFVIQNQTSSEAVRVTNLNFIIVPTGAASTNYSNLKTSETSGSGAVPINWGTAGDGANSTNNFSVDFTIAPGATKILDVFSDVGADVSNSLVVNFIATARGANSNVDATSTTKAGQTITVAAGTFDNAGIVVSGSTAPQYIAAANGATDATMATYNFKSASGTATISELKFAVTTTGGATHSSVTSVRVGSQSATVVSGVAYLTNLNIAVPNGGSGVNVPVYFTYGPVGTNGNTSGDTSFVEMTYIKYTSGGTTGTLVGGQATVTGNTLLGIVDTYAGAAVGSTAVMTMKVESGATAAQVGARFQPGMIVAMQTDGAGAAVSILEVQSVSGAAVTMLTLYGDVASAGNNEDVYFYSIPQTAAYASTANNGIAMDKAGLTVDVGSTSGTDAMVIVGSKPTLTVVDSSAQLINGLVKVGSVTVAADAKGDVALNALPLTFNSTGYVTIGTGTNNLVVKNATDQSTVNTTNDTLAVSAGGTDDTLVTFVGGYNITAGQSATFDIYATAATVSNGPGANVLSMKLGTSSSLTWTDLAGSGSTAARTGALIYNYPTNSSVIND